MAFGVGREYTLKIVADVKDAVKGVDQVADKTKSMKDKMMGYGKAVAAGLGTAAVIEFGHQVIEAGKAADEGMDAVESVFGSASKEVIAFSKTVAEKMGMSSADYQKMAAKSGQVLTQMGLSQDEAAKRTETMSQRAADLATIFGGDATKAMEAFDKATLGQTRGLKEYGINISNAEIEARAFADGNVDAEGKVTDAGKAIAAQELILEATAKQAGEYAKNSGDLGSQQDIMAAKFDNLKATLAEKLIPVLEDLMTKLTPIVDFIAANIGWIAPLVAGIAAIVGVLYLWNAAQWAINIALAANPIGLVVVAVIALAAAFIYLYTQVDWFKQWIDDHWIILVAAMLGPYPALIAGIYSYWDEIINAFKWFLGQIQSVLSTVWTIITTPFVTAFEAVVGFFSALPGQIRGFLSDTLASIKQVWSSVYETLTSPIRTAWLYIQDLIGWIGDMFSGLGDSISNAMSGLANIIKKPFESAFTAIKNFWNNTVGGFGFEVPSWVPGIGGKGFKIPRMATGGIVTRPTIALIGEAGPEAVVPLSHGGGFGNVVINVYALTASAEVGRKVFDALTEYERISGRRLAG
jgi:phage-related protein